MLGFVVFKLICNVRIEKQVHNAFLSEIIFLKLQSMMFRK